MQPSDTPSITPILPVTKPKSATLNKRRPKPKMFTDKELQAIGAAVWAALEEDTETLHARFFPNEQNGGAPISKSQLSDKLYSAMNKLRKLGVDMG